MFGGSYFRPFFARFGSFIRLGVHQETVLHTFTVRRREAVKEYFSNLQSFGGVIVHWFPVRVCSLEKRSGCRFANRPR